MNKAKEYYRLYTQVSRLNRLQNRRHPMFYRKMAMKVFMIFMNIFVLGYLFFIGLTLKGILQMARPGMEPYNLFDEGMVFLLVFDMAFRFMGQETPSVKARPFLLLPVSRKMITDCYLIRILLTPFNLIWMALLVPFCARAVFPFYGFAGSIGYLCGWWLMIVLNSYFYLLTRTLILRHFLWCALPVVVYGGLLLPVFLPDVHFMGYFFMYLGEGWMKGHVWSYLAVMAAIAGIFLLNRKIQTNAVYLETAGNVQPKSFSPHIKSELRWFDRLGMTGEFMKMEIRSALRNRTVRSQAIMLTFTTLLFSLVLAFAPDVYGDAGNAFWCYYCFFMVSVPLQHTLSTEGNYMDGLMVHKQLLTDLLKGKYFFYCLLELIPLLLMITAVATDAISFGRWVTCYLLAVGFCLPLSMQMAVYTNYATPMNQKLTKGSSNNRLGMTFLWTTVVLIIPIGLQLLLTALFSETAAYIVLCLIGLTGFLTHNYWLSNLYKRIYRKRYVNMEGFRSSRQS